jgi:hypothetical protein
MGMERNNLEIGVHSLLKLKSKRKLVSIALESVKDE